MGVPVVQVDAFTDRPFTGNPAAVCVLESEPESAWMLRVASEMNLSETAFSWPEDGGYRLRWFTPTMEVDLCGHATLATAHVLWETARLAAGEPVRFRTLSGTLGAERHGRWIELDFPAEPPAVAELPELLAAGLGVDSPAWVGRNRMDYLVELEDETAVRALDPDPGTLKQVPTRGVVVTARSGSPEHDFVSRFFAPAAGVDEDPVTGSAHCCLGPYWSERLGKTELIGYQASSRGGVVKVRTAGDRVALSGQAVTVLRGELVAPGSCPGVPARGSSLRVAGPPR